MAEELRFTPLITTQLAPDLDDLSFDFIQELSNSKECPTEELVKMLRLCPVNRVAIEIKALRAATALGEYHHSDDTIYPTATGEQTITEWVRGNFDSMRGSLPNIAGKLVRQAYALGCCCGEIVWEKKAVGARRESRLKKINILNPLRYSFGGGSGEVDRVIYKPRAGAPFAIPYSKLVHIYSPSIEEPDDPRGDPQAARAYPIFKARQMMLENWTYAGLRQATGLLVIKAPSDKTVPVLDQYGRVMKNPNGTEKTEPALFSAMSSAKRIKNGSVFGTDKENDVLSIPGNAGEGFFNTALMHYQKLVFYAYGVPSTIFDDTASGIGNSGINAGHRLILDNQIEAIVDTLRDELLEKVIRPLLLVNFGTKFESNLGEFRSPKFLDPAMAATRVSNLNMAIAQGTIDANDLEAINRLREDSGLSPLPKERFDQMLLAKLLAQQEQAQQEMEAPEV